MVALHYLKYQHDLSDEDVVLHWLENPYWQHFSGERYFQHRLPIDASSMTRWRQRLGEAGAEQMLRETIAAGIRMGAIRSADLKRINVDTTVQTKAVRYPTDARLYHCWWQRLGEAGAEQMLRETIAAGRCGDQAELPACRQAATAGLEPLRARSSDEAGAGLHAQITHAVGADGWWAPRALLAIPTMGIRWPRR